MQFSNLKEFRYGWPVVFASAIGIGVGMSPLPIYTLGVFAVPLSQVYGWRMDQIMLAMPIFTLGALVMSPLIGLTADKAGVRKTVLVSQIAFGLVFMAFALIGGNLTLYFVLWGLLSVAGAGTLPMTWTRAVNNWFQENRGLALGLALVGTGIFGSLTKLWAGYLIGKLGWQIAYIGVGLLPIILGFPLTWLFFRDTNDPKVASKVAELRGDMSQNTVVETGGLTLGAAVKEWRFWLLGFCFVLISFAVGGQIPNLEKMLSTKGFDPTTSIILASYMGYAVVVGRLLGGYLLDRFWAPAVATIMLSLPALGCYLFIQADMSYGLATLAVIILGLAAGVEYDFMAYLVTKYFGMRHYSAIYGALYSFFALGAGFGPYFFGLSFTQTGNYNAILGYAAVAFLAGALPLIFMGKYRIFPNEAP
ncbi:MAG TPA: MFS transporter [Rhodothermales bacterium]|nr:MFS transporter [Rhodothermales bacterium]